MRLAALAAFVLLASCADMQDQIARDAARSAVRPVLAERFPGVPLEPSVDCIINNASAGEILQLARAGATQTASPETTTLVVQIATRPETIRCLATDGLTALLR